VPSPRRCLTLRDVHAYVREHSFAPSVDQHVGIELEWLTFGSERGAGQVPFEIVSGALEAVVLPAGGALTYEPGGQVELSSRPHRSLNGASGAAETDGAVLRSALAARGVRMVGVGMDPMDDRRRVIDTPRYRGMEAYFATNGSSGRLAMCATAAIQVNVDAGGPGGMAWRWKLAHSLSPTLAATFAHSPLQGGRPSGSQSTRLEAWHDADPTRVNPVGLGSSPADDWARYALEASLMLMRLSPDRYLPLGERLPFGKWITEGHELGFPTEDDLSYHLTTLFPPVRPRGWIELRVIDALPDPWWAVAFAVTAVLLDDDEASQRAARATASTAHLWDAARRLGLAHPALAQSARECFVAAIDALPRHGVDATPAEDFFERYTARGRSPADDRLEDWACARSPLPPILETTWT
jgi:glutamate--cysteine ligase